MAKRKALPPTFQLTVVVNTKGESSVIDVPDCVVDTDLFKRGINVWSVELARRIQQPGIYRCDVSGPGWVKGQTDLELQHVTRMCGTDMKPIRGDKHGAWANAIINTEETRSELPPDPERLRAAEEKELRAGRAYFDALTKEDPWNTVMIHRLLRNLAS